MFPTLERLFTRSQRTRFFTRPDVIQLFFCILIILANLILMSSQKLDRLEYFFLDTFFRQRPPLEISDSIVLIEIDEESLRSIGSWPWPEGYHAQMLKFLNEWGASSVVFDLIFRQAEDATSDGSFEKSLQMSENVYFPVILENKSNKKYWIHSLAMVLDASGKQRSWTHSDKRLEQYAKAKGHINFTADSDGVLRRISPYLVSRDEMYSHLSLEVAYEHLERKSFDPKIFELPLDHRGELLINWAGPWREAFNRVSYADLVRSFQAVSQGRAPVIAPSFVKDKICLIGLTANELATFYTSPFGIYVPSLAAHGNIINNILTGQFIQPGSLRFNALCLVIIGLLSSFLFIHLKSTHAFVANLVLALGWLAAAFFLFCKQGTWLFVFYPMLLILCLFVFSAIYSHIMANRERERLFNLATKDGLTGLYVIRYFREVLNMSVKECKAQNKPISVILIDIDNFKPVNDTYGHQAGDMVLQECAKVIQSKLRLKRNLENADFVARYGGEEFIMMLKNTKLEDAAKFAAERIRQAVSETEFIWEGQKIPITISVGVSALRESENVPDPMVRRADEALYSAKRTGKNKVCTAA